MARRVQRVKRHYNWMRMLKYKPIHQILLERVHAGLWREREHGQLAAAIRQDRSVLTWEAMKDVPSRKRLREGGYVHARTGPCTSHEGPFRAAWGDSWRASVRASADRKQWKQQQGSFVQRVCDAWRLPHISANPGGDALAQPQLAPAEKYTLQDIHALPYPRRLLRDQLWLKDHSKPQLEFVVDSLTVANVVNMDACCDNPRYKPAFDRMLTRLAESYDTVFQHKAGFMATHEWRPREWNVTADRLCNVCLDEQAGFRHVFVDEIDKLILEGYSLQVYSDGGLRGTVGAAAFAAFLVDPNADNSLKLAVVDAVYLHDQESAFALEVIAADRAVSEVWEIVRRRRGYSRKRTWEPEQSERR